MLTNSQQYVDICVKYVFRKGKVMWELTAIKAHELWCWDYMTNTLELCGHKNITHMKTQESEYGFSVVFIIEKEHHVT